VLRRHEVPGSGVGAAPLFDHMAMDGLEDAYERGKAGVFAESCVAKYGFTREAQDRFAIASTQRTKQANEDGSFAWEIAPMTLPGKGGNTVVKFDEQPFKAKLDKIPSLKPPSRRMAPSPRPMPAASPTVPPRCC
jgi:acetyl-CoA C-acetyltransferase